jgi:integrase
MIAAPPTLRELAGDYFAQYEGRDDSRPSRIAWWIDRLGDRPAESITDDDVFEALEDLATTPARRYAGLDADGRKIFRIRAPKRSNSTVNRYHVALGALFSWAIKRRRMPKGWENPCRKIERQREPAGVVRFLSDAEREQLLEACRASSWDRLYLLVILAITTGARRGELMGLHWSDIDLERGCAYVCTTKNGDRRVLPLTPIAIEALQKLQRRPAGLVFGSRSRPKNPFNFEEPWRAARKAAKLPNFRFHDLRHTCASYLAQNGASLLEIADVMGHRQLSMTKRYAHLTIKSKASLVNRVLGEIR